MSEEEVIKQLKKACIFDENCYEVDCLYEKDLIAIRGLYDLYNKEKEKNAKLKSRKYITNTETQEIKEIPISDNYISKDKIREKIKELTELTIDPQCDKNVFYKIEVLKSLLEE